MSYELKNWNEEVMKWLAVAMILAIALMTVIPGIAFEFRVGWVVTYSGFAWSAGNGDYVGATLSAIGMGVAIASLFLCPPATAVAAAVWY